MCVRDGNVVLRSARSVRRIYTLYLRRDETLSIISKHTTNSKLNFYRPRANAIHLPVSCPIINNC